MATGVAAQNAFSAGAHGIVLGGRGTPIDTGFPEPRILTGISVRRTRRRKPGPRLRPGDPVGTQGHMHGIVDPYDFIVQGGGGGRPRGGELRCARDLPGRPGRGVEPFGEDECTYDWAELRVDPSVKRFFKKIYNSGDRI